MGRRKSRKRNKQRKKAESMTKPPSYTPPKVGGLRTLKDFPYIEPACAAMPDWIAGPCSQSRDSDACERSNFDAMCDMLDEVDPNGGDWEIVRFGHFGVGFIDCVFARPSSKAVATLGLIREKLREHPLLDDGLCAEYTVDDMTADEEHAKNADSTAVA